MNKILLLLIVGTSLAAAKKYDCEPAACKQGAVHTTCLYESPQPHPRCGKVRAASVTAAEKQEIVKLHNYYRNLVAKGMEKRGSPGPQPAGDIGPLKWNDQLAEVAQRWVNQCLEKHDECRSDGAYYVGQNKGRRGDYPDEPKLEIIIKRWYDEVQFYNGNHVDRFTGRQEHGTTGHYTQMVWGKTTEIGCGILKNYQFQDGFQLKRTTLVCNYGPGGNILDQPVYKAHRY